MARLLLVNLILWMCFSATAQQSTTEMPASATGIDRLLVYPQKLSRSLDEQQGKLERALSRQTEKYIRKLQRQEQKLRRQLGSKDSLLAKELQLGEDSAYQQLREALQAIPPTDPIFPGGYAGRLDSMTTTLRFLQQQGLPGLDNPTLDKLKNQYAGLQQSFQQTERLNTLVQQRKALLKEKLGQLPLGKTWTRYQKQVIYYQQQLDQYKQMLNNPVLLEQKALAVLRELPAFRKFFDKYSFLGTLFRLPGQVEDMDAASMLNGLQTRTAVMQELVNRMGSTATAQQAINQGMQQGQAELASLQNRLMNALEGGESTELPGFTPNPQKSKTFLQRIELGSNIQSTPSTRFLPVSTDIGLSVGYKLNRKSLMGVGMSYRMGWGQDIRHLQLTHEGVGLRTFVDIRVQKSWWITGGGEWNYRQKFNNLSVLKTVDHWQRSVLLGVQKKQKVGKRTSTASILYDALWNRHSPQSQPVLFRVGYNFR